MSSPETVARYGLVRPAMGDALVAVHRAHRANAATVWAQLLHAAGLAGDETDDNALHRMIDAMAAADPVLRISARSLRTRLRSYAHLSAAHGTLSTVHATVGEHPLMNAVDTSPLLHDPAGRLSDPRRLLALAGIDLDNPDLQRKFDAISARTAGRLGLPIGLVSLVLDTTQIFAGSHGLDGWLAETGGTSVEWSFCAHTVTTGQPYIVADAVNDAVQADNPLVTIDNVASYAGVPVILDGQVLGAHCVIGATAHAFTDTELTELRTAAADVTAVLQQHLLPA